jgi:hypothetical protein
MLALFFFYGDNGELKREGRLSRGPGFGFFSLEIKKM